MGFWQVFYMDAPLASFLEVSTLEKLDPLFVMLGGAVATAMFIWWLGWKASGRNRRR